MERNQTLSIALGTAGVGCTLAYLAYSHWENDDTTTNKVTTDDVGTKAIIEKEDKNNNNEENPWYSFLFSNSNTENDNAGIKIGEDGWSDGLSLRPENKKMEKSALKESLKENFEKQ
mgnify:CR=1 FL=1